MAVLGYLPNAFDGGDAGSLPLGLPSDYGLSSPIVAERAKQRRLLDTLDAIRSGRPNEQAIRAAAKQQQFRDALAMRRAQLGASVGTYQNPEVAKMGFSDWLASEQARRAGGAAPGQNVDPRWSLGGVSVGGMGLKAPASTAPVPMDRSALADRLAQLRGEGGKYAVSSLTQVTPERRAEIAAMRKAALESRGVTNLADRLSQARRARMESNVPRMLASKSQAVRDKGNALLEAMNGGKSSSPLDMDGIIKKAQAIARTYGAAAGRWYAENATKMAQDKAEMDFRSNEGKLNRESNEKIGLGKVDNTRELLTDPVAIYLKAISETMTKEQALEHVKTVMALAGKPFNGLLGIGDALGGALNRPMQSPESVKAGVTPVAPAIPLLKPPIPETVKTQRAIPFSNPIGSGVVVDEPYNPRSSFRQKARDLWDFVTSGSYTGVPLARY